MGNNIWVTSQCTTKPCRNYSIFYMPIPKSTTVLNGEYKQIQFEPKMQLETTKQPADEMDRGLQQILIEVILRHCLTFTLWLFYAYDEVV